MKTRTLKPGEDLQKWNEGIIVCQTLVRGGFSTICQQPVERAGTGQIGGKTWALYRCPKGHRFGVRTLPSPPDQTPHRQVVDVPSAKPVFGDPNALPF